MALQTFTAGQVLTAAQVTALQANGYNQTVSTKTSNYILVAADKGTRVVMNSASATTITVNTSLFSAGDTVFIQNIGAGATTITAGTATVSTSQRLILPQYGGGMLYFTSTGVSIFFPTGAVSGEAYAQQAGTGTTTVTGATITFTSGRFSVAPLAVASINGSSVGNTNQAVMGVGTVSATSAVFYATSGGAQVAQTFNYTAVQMTSSAAAG